jgi:hypothetical protein
MTNKPQLFGSGNEVVPSVVNSFKVLLSKNVDYSSLHYRIRELPVFHWTLSYLLMADLSMEFVAQEILLHYLWVKISGRMVNRIQISPSEDGDVSTLKEFMITLHPGPFAIQDGVLRNDCLKSCLRWCQGNIASASRDTYARWHGALQPLWVLYFSYGPEFTLFCYLWQKWQFDDKVVSSFCVEGRMGLSAAHVLSTICLMLTGARSAPDLESEYWKIDWHASLGEWREYMNHLWPVCTGLLVGDERDLAMSFMDVFKWGHDCFLTVPIDVRRSYARSMFEDHLTSPLSELLPAEDQPEATSTATEAAAGSHPERSTSHPRFSILSQVSKVTLSTSIRSSNSTLASFKRIRDLARDTMRLSASTGGTRFSAIDEEVQTLSDRLSILSVKTEEHAEDFNNKKRVSKTRKSGSLSGVTISSPTLIRSTMPVVERDFDL